LEPIEGTPKDIDEDYVVEVPEPTQEPIYQQISINEKVVNILLLGTDVRPNETGNGRTDSMMLLSYNRDSHTAKLTSFMRDIWIHIPGRGWNRINASYAFGNIGLTINTINENFGLDIQNYIVIDFEGFKKIVDELGGVEVMLSEKEIDYINKVGNMQLTKEEGKQLLNGEQMLIHCRNRHTGDGDFGRTQRQRDVMLAFFNKAKSVKDPILLAELLSFAMNYIQTNMAPDMLFTLGLEVVASDSFRMEQGRIPFDDTLHYANEDGRSVISIDLDENTKLLHEFLYSKAEG
jgi:LCP family protein required for cell wall assembly